MIMCTFSNARLTREMLYGSKNWWVVIEHIPPPWGWSSIMRKGMPLLSPEFTFLMAQFVTALIAKICYHCQKILGNCRSRKTGKKNSSITMASTITTLLFSMLIVNGIEMRQQSKKEKEGLWVVRQVVPLPAEEVVIYIDAEEEMVDQEKEEEVVFVAKTSKRERKKTATLPIVIGVVGGVVFVLLSLLAVLFIRPIRCYNPRFSQKIVHNCKTL